MLHTVVSNSKIKNSIENRLKMSKNDMFCNNCYEDSPMPTYSELRMTPKNNWNDCQTQKSHFRYYHPNRMTKTS